MGTMPMTQTVTERMGVPRHYASFAIPLGATTKMDGCAAIYPALAAIFVANFFGIDLSIMQYLLIVLVSVLGSAATAGMGRTALNVTGQSLVAVIVAQREKILDRAAYDASARVPFRPDAAGDGVREGQLAAA